MLPRRYVYSLTLTRCEAGSRLETRAQVMILRLPPFGCCGLSALVLHWNHLFKLMVYFFYPASDIVRRLPVVPFDEPTPMRAGNRRGTELCESLRSTSDAISDLLKSRRLAVRRWLTSLSCRCFVSMDLLKTIVVLSSTTIVVFIVVLVLFGCI